MFDDESETAMRRVQHVVGGVYTESESSFSLTDPVTGADSGIALEANAETINAAVEAARNAVNGAWGSTTAADRARFLRRIAEGIESRFDEFVSAEVMDTGKPIDLAQRLDVSRAIANFRAFADVIATAGLTSYLTEFADGSRALNYATRNPVGVVAVITPWNLPLLLLTWKVAPALACGNAVVVKPSENTPRTATLLARVITEAGIPDGVYNVVHGFGPGSAGEHLTRHPGVDAVTFTGSTAAGSTIMSTVAPRVTPVSFELGGKNAAVVFADADLDLTIEGLGRSLFMNTGQVCLCTERVYIERSVFDEVAGRLVSLAESLTLGHPRDPDTTTGPLISKQHREKVLSYFDLARDEGATLLTGGGIPNMPDDLSGGFWIEPTLWTDLDNSTRVMREEIFGPVASLVPFDTEDEAIALANDTEYGLASSVWTTNLDRGHRVAQRMRVGLSWLNSWYLRDLRSPFGGVGLSGIGREGGDHSLDFYSELTNVCVRLG